MRPFFSTRLSCMSEASFRIKYQGANPEYHEMDAAHLAEALMGLSEMGRVAYRVMHPEDTHTLQVKVNALEVGSFVIDLEAVLPPLEHLYGQFVGLFNTPDATAFANASGFVAILGSAVGLVKWIGGREHKIKRDGDTTTITTVDGDETQVSTVIYNISGNAQFLTATSHATKPLEDLEYDLMQIQDPSGEVVEQVHEDDRGYFSVTPDTREKDETLDLEVLVETVQLGDSRRMWTFKSGDQKFNAKVLDEDFLAQVKKEGILVNAQTRLLVQRREIRTVQPNGEAKSAYSITKVHNVINHGQDPLFD